MTDADRLKEAEQAYHDLNIGNATRVFVDQNGERVEFKVANKSELAAYIRELKGKLPTNTQNIPRPLGFIF